MSSLLEVFKEFPALWALVGLVTGALVFERLAKVYREQITSLRDERNDYKMNLHAVRSECQNLQLKVADLESRPNLSVLSRVLEHNTEALSAIVHKMEERDHWFERLETGFKNTTELLAALTKQLNGQRT